jgi:hypothetical protein
MMGFGMLIPLVLLLGLGIGWLVLRRTPLPRMKMKQPPSGARPWPRTRVPNPDNLGGNIVMASNVGSFVPLPKIAPLSDTDVVPTESETFSAMPASNDLAPTSDFYSISSGALATSEQGSAPNDGTRYWEIKEDDSSLSSDDLPTSIQGGSLHEPTRYWKIREDSSNAVGAVSFPPEPSAYAASAPLSWSENPAESANGDQPQTGTDSPIAAPLLEKGLLTNAPYYAKLPSNEQAHTWEWEYE